MQSSSQKNQEFTMTGTKTYKHSSSQFSVSQDIVLIHPSFVRSSIPTVYLVPDYIQANTMAPNLRYYIVRPDFLRQTANGLKVEQPLVPLIAVDELPEWLDIISVPRQLTAEQAATMANLGYTEKEGTYDIDIDSIGSEVGTDSSKLIASPGPEPTSALTAPTSTGEGQALMEMHPAERMKAAFPSTPSPTIQPSTTPSPSSIPTSLVPYNNKLTPVPHPSTPPSPKPPKKTTIYCRHWVIHGTCKWGPNCRFQHTMPATPSGLAECGLRDFPPWWTAAMGLTMSGDPRWMMAGRRRKTTEMFGMLPVPVPYGYGNYSGAYRERRGREEVHPVHTSERGRKVRGLEIGVREGLPGMVRLEGEGGRGRGKGRGGSVVGVGEVKKEGVVASVPQVQAQAPQGVVPVVPVVPVLEEDLIDV